MNKILMPMCHLFGSSHDRSLLKFVSSPVGSRVFWKVPSEFQRDRLHQLEIISCILSLLFLSAMEVQVWSASTFPNCCLCFCSRCGQHLHSFTKLIAWIIHGVPETQSICSLFRYYFYNLKCCRYFYWHNLQFNFQVIQDDRFFFFFVVNFVIHWNEKALGSHVFPILIPPPTSLPTRFDQRNTWLRKDRYAER